MYKSKPEASRPKTYTLDELIRSELLAWDNSLNGYSFMRRNYQLTINVDVPEQNVLFNGGQMDIHFVVNVDKPTDHTSQEELLHAAQISLWGTDRIPTYLAGKIDEQLVHTSVVLDMALSRAAVETGTISHWQNLVTQQTALDRQKYQMGWYWDQTLLGKRLNERFLYESATLAEIGICWRNLGKYFDGMFNRDGEIIDKNMSMCFELGCLAYGAHHRDFSFMLVDLPIDESMTDEEAGRIVVDWAKQLITYCEDQGLTTELLTHHTDVTELPEKYFTFFINDSILSDLRFAAQSELRPLATELDFDTAQRISRAIHYEMVTKLVAAYKRYLETKNEAELDVLLREYDVPWSLFRQAIARAKKRFEEQERANTFFLLAQSAFLGTPKGVSLPRFPKISIDPELPENYN